MSRGEYNFRIFPYVCKSAGDVRIDDVIVFLIDLANNLRDTVIVCAGTAERVGIEVLEDVFTRRLAGLNNIADLRLVATLRVLDESFEI